MIVYYSIVSNKEIRKEAKKAIREIKAWFKKNPKRKDCRIQVWYGKAVVVKPNFIERTINQAADEACK